MKEGISTEDKRVVKSHDVEDLGDYETMRRERERE
jgi:hypothetical protein